MPSDASLQSAWGTWEEILEYLTPGDLLEFRRVLGILKIYTHWAVYIGPMEDNPRVIHYSTPEGDFGGVDVTQAAGSVAGASGLIFGTDKATVRCDALEHVAGQDKLRINNSMDRYHQRYEPNHIIRTAQDKLGSGSYSLTVNNCEHFAKFCRYGNKISDQVNISKRAVISVATATVAIPVGLAGLPALGALAVGAAASLGTAAVWEIGHRAQRALQERRLYGVNS